MKRDMKIAYLLLLLTGAFGGHRFYTQKWQKGLIYLVLFWVSASLTLGYSILAVLTYEALTLPRKVLISNGEVKEDPSKSLLEKFMDVHRSSDSKKEIEELEVQLKKLSDRIDNDKLLEMWEIEERENAARKRLEKMLIEQKKMNDEVDNLKRSTIYWQEVSDEESVGVFTRPEELYPSKYYMDELKSNRTKQKEMKKNEKAASARKMTLDGSKKKGEKLQKDNVKQILRAFDNESNVIIKTITIKNYNSKKNALNRSFEQLNKINSTNGVEVSSSYLNLKEEELELAHKGLIMKEEERELLREQRERERDEKKALKEIEDKKAVVDKDISHYDKMVENLKRQITELKDENRKIELEKEITDLEDKKEEKEKEKESLDFREKNAKAGYVYIISNIGSFGENIFKIGVTRRLNPNERIRELSSASVPFKFDVHAMVFSDDAFKLESSLHNTFNDQRLNLVNNRKEFFQVSIDEINKALKKHENLTINFNEEAEALEYRESKRLRNMNEND